MIETIQKTLAKTGERVNPAGNCRRPHPGRDSGIRRFRDSALMVIDMSALIAIAAATGSVALGGI
jgi:hypothetical protein